METQIHSLFEAKIPPLVKFLGYAGLIPFLGCALAVWINPGIPFQWLEVLLTYAASILSFLGGLHWAFAMLLVLNQSEKNYRYIWSVMPSLIAWLSFMLHPVEATVVLILGFLLQLWQDRIIRQSSQIPKWYFLLRCQLTLVASLSLLSALFFQVR
jgi:hypothetical protein